jgi:hypothetical protein
MVAVLSGAIGCPLTAAVLAMELTHNYGLMLPLLAASVSAHAFTVLYQRRSILTERLSRRGYHLSREYSVDPLEGVTVSQVMRASTREAALILNQAQSTASQVAYPQETLRSVAERMAAAKTFEATVVEPGTGQTLGSIRLEDMLHARACSWQRETVRQRLRRLPFSGPLRQPQTPPEPAL